MSRAYLFLAAVSFFAVGCSAQKPLGAVSLKQLVCVEEASCKQKLAEDCPRGGTLYGAQPAVVISYSCNP